MRVLVTGGAGFIGAGLVERLLAEGEEVDVIDDLSTGSLANLGPARSMADGRLSFHRLDIRHPGLADLVAARRPEMIFHLAAQADVRVSVENPAFDADVNILGSLHLCQAALAAGTRKIVFAGSGGTLYGTPETLPVFMGIPKIAVALKGYTPAEILKAIADEKAQRKEDTEPLRTAEFKKLVSSPLEKTGEYPGFDEAWYVRHAEEIIARLGEIAPLGATRPGR